MGKEIDKGKKAAQRREGKPENRRVYRNKTADETKQPYPYVKTSARIDQKNDRTKKQPPH
jgi:hypothetical protein